VDLPGASEMVTQKTRHMWRVCFST